jgi:hypothetical protein
MKDTRDMDFVPKCFRVGVPTRDFGFVNVEDTEEFTEKHFAFEVFYPQVGLSIVTVERAVSESREVINIVFTDALGKFYPGVGFAGTAIPGMPDHPDGANNRSFCGAFVKVHLPDIRCVFIEVRIEGENVGRGQAVFYITVDFYKVGALALIADNLALRHYVDNLFAFFFKRAALIDIIVNLLFVTARCVEVHTDGIGLFDRGKAHNLFVFQNHMNMVETVGADTIRPSTGARGMIVTPFVSETVTHFLGRSRVTVIGGIVENGEPRARRSIVHPFRDYIRTSH